MCYILTRTGIPTDFTFVEGTYGPYSKEVKDAITVLSNANFITERQRGKMIETVVAPEFRLQADLFSKEDLENTHKAIDLLSRIKSIDHAELVATILFSYDELTEKGQTPTDWDVFNHVLSWKPRWKGKREEEIRNTIFSLCTLRYMTPAYSGELICLDDDV